MLVLDGATTASADLNTMNYPFVTLSTTESISFTVSLVNDDGSLSLVSTDDGRIDALDAAHQTIVLYGGPTYRIARTDTQGRVYAYFNHS